MKFMFVCNTKIRNIIWYECSLAKIEKIHHYKKFIEIVSRKQRSRLLLLVKNWDIILISMIKEEKIFEYKISKYFCLHNHINKIYFFLQSDGLFYTNTLS